MDIIGVDIGGTKCAVLQGTKDGQIGRVKRFPTAGAAETLSAMFSAIKELPMPESPVFGISCGGPLDSKKGLILSPPNLPGWEGIHITGELTKRFGGAAYLMNDANAGTLAEWKFGAGRGFRNVVFLTHGTGMGAGIILDGRLYLGSSGDAGEVGHIRLADDGPVGFGKAGSFEGFCSGGGISQLADSMGFVCESGLSGKPSAYDVAVAAEGGDAKAIEILALSGRYLGRALSTLIDILNPEVIVLGSIYVRSGKFLEASMRQALEKETLSRSLKACKVVPAELGEDIGNYAAIAVAVYGMAEAGG